MGLFRKGQNLSSSGPESYVPSERWQELRRSLDRVDLPRVQWNPNSPGLDETQRVKENYNDWEEYYKWLDEHMKLGDYARNKKRSDELIAYAAPYRLNIVTDYIVYYLRLEDSSTGLATDVEVPRANVDHTSDPERALKGYIDVMRRDLDKRVGNPQTGLIDDKILEDLMEYAKPFDLIFSCEYSALDAQNTVTFSLRKVPDYGYKTTTVVIPDTMQLSPGAVGSMLRAHIDKMRMELGWKKVEDSMPVQPAQPSKPFILECPDHGGQMVPGDEENLFVCLVPDCKKRARRKFKRHVSGGMAQPPALVTSTMTIGSSVLPPGTEFKVNIDRDSFLRDDTVVQNLREAFRDAHGNVWQRND